MFQQVHNSSSSLLRRTVVFLILFLALTSAQAQNTISGTVYDDAGVPLPGVSVLVQGTENGVVTDFDGNFQISFEGTQTLVISYVGFATQTIELSQSQNVTINLKPDVAALDEVVVVGYGTQKRESVVGAISQLDGDNLVQRGVQTNLTDALSGQLPGVTVLTSTGIPGGPFGGAEQASQILIRGRSTPNDASPLILVDGVERNIQDVDPLDVATISVLKDASATAVYGVRGANGVILITTKRGKTGQAQFRVDANYAVKSISRLPDVLDSYTSLQAKNYGIINELTRSPNGWNFYVSQRELEFYRTGEFPYAYPNIDWQDELTNDTGRSYKVNLGVSGGTDFVKYYGSIGYTNDGDILNTRDVGQGYDPDFKYERYNFRTNLDFNLSSSTKLSVNLNGFYGEQQKSGAPIFGFWYGVYSKPSTTPILRYEDGIYGFSNDFDRLGENAFAQLNFSGIDIQNRAEVNSDITLIQDLDFITKGLSIQGKIAYDNAYATRGRGVQDDGVLLKLVDPIYYTLENPGPIEDYTTYREPSTNSTGFNFSDAPLNYLDEIVDQNTANQQLSQLLYRFQLNYDRTFANKHAVTALLNFQRQANRSYRTDDFRGIQRKREEYAARLTYAYDRRYNIELTSGYNGSERFGPGYKFEFFPSVGLGWTVSNESFFEPLKPTFSLLKFRYSGGLIGNDNAPGLAPFAYLDVYERLTGNNSSSPFGNANNQVVFGPDYYVQSFIGNPDLRWETAFQQNIGIDLGFFDNKLGFNGEFFRENRKDILRTNRITSDIFGATPPPANVQETKLRGYELVLNWKDNIGDFSYYVSANFARAVDEYVFAENAPLLPDYRKDVGFQIGQNRGQVASGIINSWDEMYTGVIGFNNNQNNLPGEYRIIDFNADGYIDANDNIPNGYPTRPQNTYGLNLGGDYKGISFNLNFFGQFNVTQTTNQLSEFNFGAPVIYDLQLENTWQPEYGNANPTYRMLNVGNDGAESGSASFYARDASFLRLKSAELAYTLPKSFIGKIGLKNFRLFVNGNNLILWSDFPVDLEGQDFNYRNYPVTRQVNFGMTANF